MGTASRARRIAERIKAHREAVAATAVDGEREPTELLS